MRRGACRGPWWLCQRFNLKVLRGKTERKVSVHELCADCLKLAQASVSIVQFEGVTMCGLEVMGDIVHWGVGKLWAGPDRLWFSTSERDGSGT